MVNLKVVALVAILYITFTVASVGEIATEKKKEALESVGIKEVHCPDQKGTACGNETPVYYYYCCGASNTECCFSLVWWVYLVIAIILTIIIGCIVFCIWCCCCR